MRNKRTRHFEFHHPSIFRRMRKIIPCKELWRERAFTAHGGRRNNEGQTTVLLRDRHEHLVCGPTWLAQA